MKPAAFLALLLLAGCAVAPGAAQAPLPAFPGAEGAGRFALGGRGGQVIKVTNLDNDGPGSLRAAVETKGPRTVVFTLSGTIRLKSPLKISEPRLTIAGQTVPGDGITLADDALVVSADDVVIRYIRSRLGDVTGVEGDAVWINKGSRIILDHVSASWSVDETLSVSARYAPPSDGPRDVTVQWSIIGESLNGSKHAKGEHGYGSLVRGGRGSQFSFHHNLWASHLARMPRPGNYEDAKTDPQGAFMDFRNNVFYNWGGDSSGYNADTASRATYNFVGNAFVSGPDTKNAKAFKESNPLAWSWFDANAMNGAVPADPWSLVTGKVTGTRLAAAHPMPPVAAEAWNTAYDRVLAGAGASRTRDSVDTRIVDGVRSRTHRIIDSQADVGGWPELKSARAPNDGDNDGMDDVWEEMNGLDGADPADGPAVGPGGWTNLERYLNSLVS